MKELIACISNETLANGHTTYSKHSLPSSEIKTILLIKLTSATTAEEKQFRLIYQEFTILVIEFIHEILKFDVKTVGR